MVSLGVHVRSAVQKGISVGSAVFAELTVMINTQTQLRRDMLMGIACI